MERPRARYGVPGMSVEAFLRRFSVGRRLAAIVVVLLLPLGALSIVSVSVLDRQDVLFRESVDESIHTLLPLASLEQYLQRALVDELEARSGEHVANFGALTSSIDDTFSRLQAEANTADMSPREISDARAAWREARPSVQQLIEQARSLRLDNDAATQNRTQADLERSIRDIGEVRAHLTRAVRARYTRAAQTRHRELHWLLAGWIGTLFFTALMIGLFLYSLLRPIRALGRTARRLGAGEHDTRAAVIGNDELTELARRFNEVAVYWETASQSLRATAVQDALTGVLNRRGIMAALNDELARHEAQDQALCVLLMDLDRFKQINDEFGHGAGDQALIWVAGKLAESLRESDHLGRYGGDEFIVILPRTGIAQARETADRLSERILELARSNGRYPGISIGVASTFDWGFDSAALIKAADTSLYERKRWRRAHGATLRSDRMPV